jgi:flagellar protein FliS
MYKTAAISAYNKVGIESGVTAADPHKLISMLYQGALLAIANGKNGILRNDIPAKGKSISHAMLIIGEGLNASLNKEVGGELALSLSALYSYMVNRLLFANLNNNMEALDEVAGLLGGLKEAWDSIRPPSATQTATQTAMPPPGTPERRGEQRLYAKG